MFKTYFKTASRNLWKNRTYSLLNIAGLAIGVACAALIFLWVEDELTYNHHFQKKDLLYKVMENQINDGKILTSESTPGPLAQAVKMEIPGIRNAGRLSWNMDQLFTLNDKSIKENGVYADPSILSMLTLDFVQGESKLAFKQLGSIVISESLSKKFFGGDNPVGKIINANAKQAYSVDGLFTITGVFKDFPENSSYRFQWICNYEVFENKNEWIKPWTNNLTQTLVELDKSANLQSINKRLAGFLATKIAGREAKCFLFSMNDWNLRNHFTDGKPDGGNIKYVQLFSLIAGIILIIACINFMNLATARSEQRAREVGVRKVMGAAKGMLITQFIVEALMLSFLSLLIAIVILYWTIPAYNIMVKKELHLDFFRPVHMIFLVGIGLITGLFAGSYPAFYLSSFSPIGVLKGIKIKTGFAVNYIRRGLVIIQFTISIVLIICTLIIYQQIQHIKERDLGYNKENLITMDAQGSMRDHFSLIKNQLIGSGFVENAALSLHDPLHVYSYSSGWSWQGKDPNNHIDIHSNLVTPEYLSTMHMELLKGRDFYTIPKVDSDNVIINESMAKLMGNQGKLGSEIVFSSTPLHVVGVVKDFIFNDMYGSSAPLILLCNPSAVTVMTIRLKPNVDLKEALTKTETVFKANNPGFPFEFRFVDEEFNKLFATETLIGKLAGVFAVLAIFISCLGLFGLAAYTAERRTKEIGIRKALGASSIGLAGLLSGEFIRLVIISCLIAFPIAWWAMNGWLRDYQYRISIHWWVFGIAAFGSLAIALITVSFQSIKAALANPVQSLRIE
jgi:putative ABC transport system permease protein